MSADHSRSDHGRIDPDAVEQLLRDASSGTRTGTDPLIDLLAAAAVPARHDELGGEGAAVAAFREAHGVAPSRRRPPIKALLGTKIAAAVGAIFAVGGVALTAGTVALFTSPDAGEHRSAPPASRSGQSARQPAAPVPDTRPRSPAPRTTVPPSASPSVAALCRGYVAGQTKGGTVSGADLARLAAAAGGRDRIAAYCAVILGTPPPATSPSPTTTKKHPGRKHPPHPGKPSASHGRPPKHGDPGHVGHDPAGKLP